MEWVAIDVHIAGDAVTHRLADLFKLRVAEAAGLLTLAFAGMAQHAQHGSLKDVTDSQIESWCLWHGKRGAFATFFRAQLTDDEQTVRSWEKYNGASIREAKASRARMHAYREKKKAERKLNGTPNGTAYHTPNGTENGTRNEPRTVRPQPDLTGPDLTVLRKKRPSAAVADRPAAEGGEDVTREKPDAMPKPICDAGYEAYIARIGAVDYGRFRKALLPVYRSKSEHPSGEDLIGAIEAFAEAREADDPRFRGKYTPETFAGGIREYVRLGKMPLMDEWSEATERGRIAGLGA